MGDRICTSITRTSILEESYIRCGMKSDALAFIVQEFRKIVESEIHVRRDLGLSAPRVADQDVSGVFVWDDDADCNRTRLA